MHIDINKLKIGDKVTFGERVEKTISHICKDNGETRAVGFGGTILNRDDTLWELAELLGSGVIWGSHCISGQDGYDSLTHRNKCDNRFHLETDAGGKRTTLTEFMHFDTYQEAVEYAEKRVREQPHWRGEDGY